MRPVVTRGQAGRLAARFALAAGVLALLVLGWGGTASGVPGQEEGFVPTHPVTLKATTSTGTAVNVGVSVENSEVLAPGQIHQMGYLPAVPRGTTYFEVDLDPTGTIPLSIPDANVSLVTSAGTVPPAIPGLGFGINAKWFFKVPDTITKATLQIRASRVTSYANNDAATFTIQPGSITFVTAAPVVVPTPTTITTIPSSPPPQLTAPATPDAPVGSGSSPALPVGVGVGGLCLIAAGTAGLVSFSRRRAFYRADREGRIVLSGPPSLVAGATLPVVGFPPRPGAVAVKLLGALELEGTRRPVTAGPLLEIIVFLALNPGKSFTSVQLRESIWGLGRRPITSNTFRKYMVQLRKAFGPGVVVTDAYRYQLTEAVTSDWDKFQAFVQTDEQLTGREQALALVRGPVLHGSFDGKKNSPFSWAVGIANDIEDEITSVAVDVAFTCLELSDPGRATTAVSKGLLCSEANLRLRKVDLRVGAALGGPIEVGRRLEAGRAVMATFPRDVDELEAEARSFGWASVVPG